MPIPNPTIGGVENKPLEWWRYRNAIQAVLFYYYQIIKGYINYDANLARIIYMAGRDCIDINTGYLQKGCDYGNQTYFDYLNENYPNLHFYAENIKAFKDIQTITGIYYWADSEGEDGLLHYVGSGDIVEFWNWPTILIDNNGVLVQSVDYSLENYLEDSVDTLGIPEDFNIVINNRNILQGQLNEETEFLTEEENNIIYDFYKYIENIIVNFIKYLKGV